jgi:hypothetical protein
MPGAKLPAGPRCDGIDNIVSGHRRRGSVVVRERFCRRLRRRFHTVSGDGLAELHCGNPLASRARTGERASVRWGNANQ